MEIEGFYINLDTSTDRRRLIENNLAQEGMREYFTRFSALRGDDRPATITRSELGCYLSHQTVIAQANPNSHTFILEDDAVLPVAFRQRFFSVMNFVLEQPWDILFLTQLVSYRDLQLLSKLLSVMNRLKAQSLKTRQPEYALLDAKSYYSWSCLGYVVRAGAQKKVAACIEQDAAQGYSRPIDGVYQQAVRDERIVANCIMPYQVGIRDLESTILDRGDILPQRLCAMLINLFVEGMDNSQLYQQARSGFTEAPLNGPAFLISQMHYKTLLDMSRRAAGAPDQ